MRPIFVSHWSIIPNITFLHQTVFKILSKITRPQIQVTDLYIFYEVNLCFILIDYPKYDIHPSNGPRQANLVLIAYASSEGSGETAHPRSLARTSAARSYRHWVKRNLQTESQIPGPSEWLGMRSSNLSWRNARRHKFSWRGSNSLTSIRQDHWSMKYRSHIFYEANLCVTLIHYPKFKIPSSNSPSKITRPWNIGHWPTYILSGQSLCHTDPLSQI